MNARDLSEPPNGTTSGCPPPSQHHNYRRLLHTQQRNRWERCESGRFWKGVAQITRSRDRTFITSLCSQRWFSISSIWRADRCASGRSAGLSPPRISIRTESTDRSEHPTAKMMRAAIPNVGCRIIVISPPATSLSRSSVERSVRIRPAQVVPAAKTAGGRDCRSPYFSRSNAISDLDLE